MGGGGGGSEAEEEEREGKCQEGCLSQPLGLFRWAAGLDELKHQNTETYQKRCVSSAVSDEMHSGKGSQGNRQDVDRTQMALAYSLKRLAATAFKRFIFLYFFFVVKGERRMKPVMQFPMHRSPLLTPHAMISVYAKLDTSGVLFGCGTTVVVNIALWNQSRRDVIKPHNYDNWGHK